MATSLKASIPALARLLGESPAALYERQRALVREGLLDATTGRGPGSGVRATAESLSVLLIGLLASTSLSDAGERTRLMMRASALGTCKLTGATRFSDAVVRVLSDPAIAGQVDGIRVATNAGYATIEFKRKREAERTVFVGALPRAKAAAAGDYTGLSVEIGMAAKTVIAMNKFTQSLDEGS